VLYLANPVGSGAVKAAMLDGELGFIDTPRQRNERYEGVTWCADNGAFSDKWDAEKWWSWLQEPRQLDHLDTCLFAVAPDVVGDAHATTVLFREWGHRIRDLGYPVAYVAQDGLGIHWNGTLHAGDLDGPTVSFDSFDCLFLGGTDDFKLGARARSIVAEAKRRGKWVHGGRVNSRKRYRYMAAIGCDSADGTFLRFGPDINLPKLLSWTREDTLL
jgi:hypothetical protein